MFLISIGKDIFLNFRIAAFKKVTGQEIHEMDRSIFRPRKWFKVFRKKKFFEKKRKYNKIENKEEDEEKK